MSSPITPLAVRHSTSFDISKVPSSQLSSSQATFEEKIQAKELDATISEEESSQIEIQRWNYPRMNAVRYGSVMFSFFVMGMMDGSLGALLPYMEKHYDISYTVVSLLFLSACLGYLLAGLVNNLMHHYFGQFGCAFMGPLFHLAGFIPMCSHPPYPALPVIMFFIGLGSGLEDSAWNAWIGCMDHSNELLGIVHGLYGLGGTVGPLIATAMVTKQGWPWWYFFYLMAGFGGLELVFSSAAFWGQNAVVHRTSLITLNDGRRTTTREILTQPITWLLALFLLGYVGVEVSLGGWITTFMIRIREAEPFLAGITTTLYWLGITLGRFILGFITGRIGEKLAITIYLLLCIALEIMYWLIPSIPASIVFVMLMGFFLGPLFPAAVVAATKLLRRDYHVSTIGFSSAAGGCGGAFLPFAVGVLAQAHGVGVLQMVVLAILVMITAVWVCIPGGFRKGGLEDARERGDVPAQEVVRAYKLIRGMLGVTKAPVASSPV